MSENNQQLSMAPNTPEKSKEVSGYVALKAKVAAQDKEIAALRTIISGFDLPNISARLELIERKLASSCPSNGNTPVLKAVLDKSVTVLQ